MKNYRIEGLPMDQWKKDLIEAYEKYRKQKKKNVIFHHSKYGKTAYLLEEKKRLEKETGKKVKVIRAKDIEKRARGADVKWYF